MVEGQLNLFGSISIKLRKIKTSIQNENAAEMYVPIMLKEWKTICLRVGVRDSDPDMRLDQNQTYYNLKLKPKPKNSNWNLSLWKQMVLQLKNWIIRGNANNVLFIVVKHTTFPDLVSARGLHGPDFWDRGQSGPHDYNLGLARSNEKNFWPGTGPAQKRN